MSRRSPRQRLIALAGLVVIVSLTVGTLAFAGVIGGGGGGNGVESVLLVEPPRASGQASLDVGTSQGNLARDFQISDLDGTRHRLSDFRGRVVYLNFWASWCGPCLAELGDIQELQDRNPQRLVVIAVNRRESLGEAKDFLSTVPRTDGGTGVSFPVNGLDPDETLYNAYRGLGMPVSVFINPDGVVTEVQNGQIKLSQMERAVAVALASTSAALAH